jgi:transcriptional regulator with PAS, ATPase and Fis domain
LEPEVQGILESYSWPGNVRELENAIRHALTFAANNQITKSVLPAKIIDVSAKTPSRSTPILPLDDFRGKSLKSFLRKKEQEYLTMVINSMGGDKEKAAKALKISLATLYRKIPLNEE